uniref:Predicted protein n=1 Tax=Hordeum vulgare subsp. vulgare TaxID=112509 RepID=F2EGD7_HORVV|nr:predicted protein [Hordeum vulgare subsp. vulgare]
MQRETRLRENSLASQRRANTSMMMVRLLQRFLLLIKSFQENIRRERRSIQMCWKRAAKQKILMKVRIERLRREERKGVKPVQTLVRMHLLGERKLV